MLIRVLQKLSTIYGGRSRPSSWRTVCRLSDYEWMLCFYEDLRKTNDLHFDFESFNKWRSHCCAGEDPALSSL